MGQAEVCKARVVTRLFEEREAWVQVYRNVSDMTVRQLGRKLSGAQQALDRLTASVDASSHVRASCRGRFACVASFDFDLSRSAPCACDADPNQKDGTALVVPQAQVDTCCNAGQEHKAGSEEVGKRPGVQGMVYSRLITLSLTLSRPLSLCAPLLI